MLAASGGPDRSRLGKDDLMAEFFLKPSSSIIGPGGTIVPAEDLERRGLRGRAVRGHRHAQRAA